MAKHFVVGNLPRTMGDDDLEALVTPYGTVNNVQIIRDRSSGSTKGFGFIEMTDEKAGKQAVHAIHGLRVRGRLLKVQVLDSVELGGGTVIDNG